MDLGKPLKKYALVIAVLPRQRNHISCSYQRWTPGPAEKKTSLPHPIYKLTTHVPFLLPRPVLKHCQRQTDPRVEFSIGRSTLAPLSKCLDLGKNFR